MDPITNLIEAARSVVERWDTPLWKEAPATGEYINRLREALVQANPKVTQDPPKVPQTLQPEADHKQEDNHGPT